MVVERGVLAGALERAAVVSHAAEQLHLVRLAVRDSGLACRAETPEGGSSGKEPEATMSGESIAIGVNGQMLRAVLRRLGGRTVRLEISGPLTARQSRSSLHFSARSSHIRPPQLQPAHSAPTRSNAQASRPSPAPPGAMGPAKARRGIGRPGSASRGGNATSRTNWSNTCVKSP